MTIRPYKPFCRSSGSALVITLVILVLITVITVAFLESVMLQKKSARSSLNEQKARDMATLGMHTAIAQLRDALGTGTNSWDNPFGNFMGTRTFSGAQTATPVVGGSPPAFFWSVSPGLLTRWDYTSSTYANLPSTNKIPLFSGPSGGTNPTVNLNRSKSDGTYPIIGGTNAPPVNVQWVNVLSDPSQSASASSQPYTTANKIIGRYAFWIDDENAKININTADGTNKNDLKKSLGAGTPSEVSLQVLQQAGAPLPLTVARNIVQIARTTGFHTPQDILRADGTSPELYSNNAFNLTSYSRSPELNIFGEPKINLIPASALPPKAATQGYLQRNNITTQPLTEVYPAPAQLGAFTVQDFRYGARSNPWHPYVMAQEWPFEAGKVYLGDRGNWLMALISQYLGGHNSMGKAIQWPTFPGSGANGFLGKYSLRQLDSISVQIGDLAQKGITPEEMNGLYDTGISNSPSTLTVPYIWTGFLSNQIVSGLGRSAKINEVLINVNVFGPDPSATIPHPQMQMNLYLELYLPAGFAGVDLFNKNNGLPPALSSLRSGNTEGLYSLGASAGVYVGALNVLDMPIGKTTDQFSNAAFNSGGPNPLVPLYSTVDGNLTSSDCHSLYLRESPESDLNIPYSCWHDTVLRNDAGIDMFGNPAGTLDPDQYRAKLYHPYMLSAATPPTYLSSGATKNPGSIYAPILRMGYLSTTAGPNGSFNGSGLQEWYPGQYRTITNWSNGIDYQMKPGASSVTFSGGLIITGFVNGAGNSDPDPVPLEAAVRGVNPYGGWCSFTGEALSYAAWGVNVSRFNNTPTNPAQTTQPTDGAKTLRDRVAPGIDSAGVIPINFSVTVPASIAVPGNSVWYGVQVADPLVNKFPGDWVIQSGVTNTSSSGGSLPTIRGGITFSYNGENSASSHSSLLYKDPDSFWMPTLDQTIPRSARMPNIGYLQYLRTGMIPDDETVPLSQQKGTPFRLLNFAPSTDTSQTGATTPYRTSGYAYPDWALLDLFTIPSTLLPYGGPYGYFNYNSGWQAGSIMNGTPATMRSYSTYGGSTPGRINPNGAVIYTTDVSSPATEANGSLITRTLPLQALLSGLKINQTIPKDGSSGANAPTPSGGTAVDASAISQAIADYIRTNGPFRMPGEICNVPAIAALYPNNSTHNNRTRNDLVRQIIGNLTTQSNTFSVWVAGQSIQKRFGHTNYGEFEPGDQILSEARYHFIIERYLDPGADGVFGNTSSASSGAGNDGIVGSYDDKADSITSAQPPNPSYLYRVIASEEVR